MNTNHDGLREVQLPPSSATVRADWMMVPPRASSMTEMLMSDPKAALQNRGFSQAATTRVQHKPIAGGSDSRGSAHRMTGGEGAVWTETPHERAKRLNDEELGIRPRGGNASIDEAQHSVQHRADREREERVRAAVQEHNAARGPTLMEQHQAKRRAELRTKEEGRSDKKDVDRACRKGNRRESIRREDERNSRKSKAKSAHSDDEAGSIRDRSSSRHRRRDRSISDSHVADKDASRSKEDGDQARRKGNRDKHPFHRHYGRSSHRDRSTSPDQSTQRTDKERAARHEDKTQRRERERKKRKRDEEERGAETGAPMMVWDREAALSVSGRLMEERKRADVIKSAASLNDRFGQGKARYM